MHASAWWKDICLLGMAIDLDGDWFGDWVVRKVGNGESTLFWHEPWAGDQPLIRSFPRLFLVSNRRGDQVAEFGIWVDGVWTWSFPWRHDPFV